MLTAKDYLGRPLAFTDLVAFLDDSSEWAGHYSYALRLQGVAGLLVIVDNVQYLISKHEPQYYLIEAM